MGFTRSMKKLRLWGLVVSIGVAVTGLGCEDDNGDEKEKSTVTENGTGEGEGTGEGTETATQTDTDTATEADTGTETTTDTTTQTDTEPEPSTDDPMEGQINTVILHHSVGRKMWGTGWGTGHAVEEWFAQHNADNATTYQIAELYFPTMNYFERNDPYDYWKLWIDKAGADPPYQQQPDLDAITAEYDVVVLKHCYSTSEMVPDDEDPRVDSEVRTLANFKLQYEALKGKLHAYTQTRFLVWTLPAHVIARTDEQQAQIATEFAAWVKEDWDDFGDNIYLWDFRQLETDGGLYLPDERSAAKDEAVPDDSHPSWEFASQTYSLLTQRIVDVIEGRGDVGDITGKWQ